MKHRNGHIAPPFLHRSGQFLAGAVFEGTGRGAAKAKAQRDQQNWVVELSAIDYCIYIYTALYLGSGCESEHEARKDSWLAHGSGPDESCHLKR